MGFKLEQEKEAPQDLASLVFGLPCKIHISKLRLENAVLEIITPERKLKKKVGTKFGYNHWGLAVRNKEEFCRKLKSKGVPVLEYRIEGRALFFVKDPEGNIIEIYEG